MPTKEQKLLKLMEVAFMNGWTPTCSLQEDILDESQSFAIGVDCVVHNHYSYENYKEFSLNDMVTNYYKKEVSFMEALSKASQQIDGGTDFPPPQNLRLMWVQQPTYKRLDWLFATFFHLL